MAVLVLQCSSCSLRKEAVMTALLHVLVLAVFLALPAPAAAIAFDFESTGVTLPSDCVLPPLPQPLCVEIAGGGSGDDIPDALPGSWTTTLAGQVLFFVGTGTFHYDDPSPADNDFFGTWTDVLSAPSPEGVARADFRYVVSGGSGIFAGRQGTGTSVVDVVIAPSGFDATGAPIFGAACPGGPSGIGAYCERGRFVIAEPPALLLLLVALLATMAGRRRAAR
jgi:hypothetical protein